MTVFNPFASDQALPLSLNRMAEHPEHGQWQCAIMLRQVQYRWPGWPLEYALVTVDSALEIHQSDFLVMPPIGWEQRDEVELPDHLSTERVIGEALLPNQAMGALNAVFGRMCVFHNGGMSSYGLQANFEERAGTRATWTRAHLFKLIGEHLTVSIGEHSQVEFRAYVPKEGTLVERARGWAKGYVVARQAQQLFLSAMYDAQNRLSSDRLCAADVNK